MTDLLEPAPSTSYGFMLLANNDKIPRNGILSQSSATLLSYVEITSGIFGSLSWVDNFF